MSDSILRVIDLFKLISNCWWLNLIHWHLCDRGEFEVHLAVLHIFSLLLLFHLLLLLLGLFKLCHKISFINTESLISLVIVLCLLSCPLETRHPPLCRLGGLKVKRFLLEDLECVYDTKTFRLFLFLCVVFDVPLRFIESIFRKSYSSNFSSGGNS